MVRCPECGTDREVSLDEAVADVVTVPSRFRALLGGTDPARRHPDLGWSALGYVAHVADNLAIWAERLTGAGLGDPAVVPPYDENLLASARRYDALGVEGVLWSLERAVERWAAAVREADRRGTSLQHPGRGSLTATDVARTTRHDALHHVWDVSRTVDESVPAQLFPPTEPDVTGMLDVGDGNRLRYEVSGNPEGTPAVVFHGGPGSGCGPGWRRYFDPARYRVVLLDQRGCGGSTPDAADPATDLSVNTTQHLVADAELLREHLGFETWVVFGGSWGSTLGLAYAQAHADRVRALVLFSVVTTTAREVEWVTRDMSRVFPREWAQFRDGAPADADDAHLALAYADLLADPDPAVRDRAAAAWCAWEDAHVGLLGAGHDPRYDDPGFRYRFARLVTHYWSNAGFLGPTELLDGMARLAEVPGVLVTGTADVSGPADVAVALASRWPAGGVVLVPAAGHGAGAMTAELIAALDRFA